MIKLGLTGSIATGKSTTAQMFRDAGIPVHDSDAAVHHIYREEGVEPVRRLAPEAIVDGKVSRPALRAALQDKPELLRKLEAIVHPLVAARRVGAMNDALGKGEKLMVFDIPLLFETGIETEVDRVVVTFCAPDIQMERLLSRPGITKEAAALLIDRQMPQDEKRKRADFEIDTGLGLDHARDAVRSIIEQLRV